MTAEQAQYSFRAALLPLLDSSRVVWADQNNQTNIAAPYYSLSVSSMLRIGSDDEHKVDSDGVMTVDGSREMRVTISRIGKKGEHPCHFLSELRDKLNAPTFRYTLQASGAKLGMMYPVQNISRSIQAGEIEPRAALECVLRYHSQVTDSVGVIAETAGIGDHMIFVATKPEAT